MYDHDRDEVDVLGWEEFVLRQWAAIFIGYRSGSGVRRSCRRWSDLIESGIGCSQEIADLLVRAEILDRVDRNLEGASDAAELLTEMDGVLADIRLDLLEMAEVPPQELPGLLARQARLRTQIRAHAFGPDADAAPHTGRGRPS